MSRRAMRRGSRGNSAPGSRNSSAQQTSTAMMFLTPSVPNLEGLNLEDDSATKDAEDAENRALSHDDTGGMIHASMFTCNSGGPMMSPELEASRQLLIENLIGMVFSVLSSLVTCKRASRWIGHFEQLKIVIHQHPSRQQLLGSLRGCHVFEVMINDDC